MRRRDFLKGSLMTGAGVLGASTLAMPAFSAISGRSALAPFDLRCEYRSNPLGVDAPVPRLSWKIRAEAGVRNQVQTAYRIRVASSEQMLRDGIINVWDSGRVASGQQLHIEYRGIPLVSKQRCVWSVEVWDGEGRLSSRSEVAWWEMGLLSPSDWQATWISDGKPVPTEDAAIYEPDPAPLMRRPFEVDRAVKNVRLYATSLGYHELRLNGEPVSDEVLAPAWTQTEKRVFYSCHDVTEQVRAGQNVLGAQLGNGWRNPLPLRMWGRINIREHLPVGRPEFLGQLEIEYEDGTTDRIVTDAGWQVADGPLLKNSVYLGEVYDARLELPGWDAPGFDAGAWRPASEVRRATAGSNLQASPIPPIRATRTVPAVSVTRISDDVHIVDLGQNFAGWVRLRVQGPHGTTVRMRMGELLYEDGTLNPMTAVAGQIKRLRDDGVSVGGPGAPEVAWQENSYTLRGDGEEVYEPRFTFHGFRYVELTGYPGEPDLTAVEGIRLNTDVEKIGSFESSNERLNRIQDVVEWTFLSNLFSVQSDCPAREKFQYGGDIVASSEMAMFGFDMSTFYPKAVADFADSKQNGWFAETAPFVGIQAANYSEGAGPIGWGLAHPLLVSQLYQYYGDRRVIEDHFDDACHWVDLLEAASDGLIIDRCISDHESLDPKPVALMATAHFHQAATLVAEFADILGEDRRASHYEQLAEGIKSAFVERFLETGSGRFGMATQAAQSTALTMGLVPDSEKDAAIQRMVDAVTVDHDGHIAAGIFGTKYLLNMLSETGHNDVAYAMVDTPEYPGWGHMLENGATTLWETWAQSDNVYSQNHPMFGSVSEWLFKAIGGVAPNRRAVGCDRFTIAPFTGGTLEWARVQYESVRGAITSDWRLEGGVLRLNITVPVNALATVRIPTSDSSSLLESGKAIVDVPEVTRAESSSSDWVEVVVGSGDYSFTATAPR